MKRLTLAEARKQIEDRELWLDRTLRVSLAERDFADEDYPGRGLEFEFFEIPN